ncbi:MAG: hypothetical protein FWD13_02555 [Treponema sp.]|nr:hypothetical protein [Treponema sp.]
MKSNFLNSGKFFILILFLILFAQSGFAFGNKEKTVSPPIVRVTGIVRLVGSEPLYELVISGTEKEWYVARNEMYKLHDLQHRTVTVAGEETVIELRFANGRPAGTRRELRNIVILEIHNPNSRDTAIR